MAPEPFAQSYTVVDRVTTPGFLTDGPGLLRLPSGKLLATYHFRTNDDRLPDPQRERIAWSEDEGQSWRVVSTLPYCDALPFVHDGALHLLAFAIPRRNLYVLRSENEGCTWSKPVQLAEGHFWNSPTGYALKDNHLYWAVGASPKGSWDDAVAIAGNLGKDLLDPSAWRLSNVLRYPGTPPLLSNGMYRAPTFTRDHWLESNTVNVRNKLRVFHRVRIDSYSTVGITALCTLEDDGVDLRYRFDQFHPLPGAQNMFHIIYDALSDLFWMTCNLVTDSQDTQGIAEKLTSLGFMGTPGNERRFLILCYSIDALNWFQAGCLARGDSHLHSFHYTTPYIDGDELLFISRTSANAPNQHDSDLITFHRVPNFRDLALDLHPQW